MLGRVEDRAASVLVLYEFVLHRLFTNTMRTPGRHGVEDCMVREKASSLHVWVPMGFARKSDLCATALEAGAGCKDAERRVAIHTELPTNWLHSVKGQLYMAASTSCPSLLASQQT